MSNANTQLPDDDFGFSEPDFRNASDPGLRAHANERIDGPDATRHLEDDSHQTVAEHEPPLTAQPVKKTFFEKYGLYIGVGSVALTLFGVLGWIAAIVLSPAPVLAQHSNAPDQFGSQPAITQSSINTGAAEPMQFGGEPSSHSNTRDQRHQESAYASSTEDVPGSVLPITPRTEQEQDEQFYDTLVSAAEQNLPVPTVVDVTAVAQADTPTQIAPETADKFAAIAVALANQSKEMTTLLDAVKSVNAEIAMIKEQVVATSTKNNAFEGKLNQLTLSLNNFSKSTESRINDISKAAVAAAIKAVKNESSNKSGKNTKLVLVGGPMQSDYTSAKAKHQDKKVSPKPILVAAQTPIVTTSQAAKPKAQPEGGNQAVKCGAKTISQVWKVKGLTYSGAYVRRNDGSALMLHADMEVPGFGRVKSFDPESRTVCTTSGLIAR